MTFWKGQFRIPCNETAPKDTFLKLKGWRKGIAYINGINLGRYWPSMGPQQTLYVPGAWIRPKCRENSLIVFEQEHAPLNSPFFELVKVPIIDGPTPSHYQNNFV
jgi:beta-galactosidase